MREFSRELEAAAFGRPADVTPAPVMVSSIAPPTSPTIGYSATQVPPTPVRQPAARAPRDARKADSDRAAPENGSSPTHAIAARAKELARSAMGQLSSDQADLCHRCSSRGAPVARGVPVVPFKPRSQTDDHQHGPTRGYTAATAASTSGGRAGTHADQTSPSRAHVRPTEAPEVGRPLHQRGF